MNAPPPQSWWRSAAGELALIAGAVLFARVLLFLVVSWRTGATLADYAESTDGAHYLLAAKAWLQGPELLEALPAAKRLFPGVPMLIAALLWCGVPAWCAALLPSWLGAAASAVLAACWCRDVRVGWAMAFLPPIYLYASSLISTETMALVFSLVAVALSSQERGFLAGVALGLAVLCRPFAVFAALGIAAGLFVAGRWRQIAWSAAGGGATLAVGLTAVWLWCGDVFLSARTYDELYGGGILAWPFQYLVGVPLRGEVPAWKIAYVGSHAAIAAAAVYLAVRQLRRPADQATRSRDVTVAVWLTSAVAFNVCIASAWAFHEFPRFLVPALAALFVALRPWLPSSRAIWLLMGLVSLLLALGPALRNVRPEVGPGSSIDRAGRPASVSLLHEPG